MIRAGVRRAVILGPPSVILYQQNFEAVPLADLDGVDGWSRVEGVPEKPLSVVSNSQLEGVQNAAWGASTALSLYRRMLVLPQNYDAEFILFKEIEGDLDNDRFVGFGMLTADNHNPGFDWIVQHITDTYGAMNVRCVVNAWGGGADVRFPVTPMTVLNCRVERRAGANTSFYVNGILVWEYGTSAALGDRMGIDGQTEGTVGRIDAIKITAR